MKLNELLLAESDREVARSRKALGLLVNAVW